MKLCIIVDGYSAGRQFPKALQERGIHSLHVQSSTDVFTSLARFDERDYDSHFIYLGDIEKLISDITHFLGADNEISCVIAGSEPGVELADLLSERLGLLTSNGTSFSRARRNKLEMRDTVKRAGLATPLYCVSSDLSEINGWIAENTSFPVVVKAIESAGTDGVFICHTPEQVSHAFLSIVGHKNIFGVSNTRVLVESYLHGEEYVVNSVSCNGKHKINDIWLYRKKMMGDRKVYDRETLLDFDGAVQSVLVEYAHRVLDALAIKYGPSHAEIMLTDAGPILVEVAARVSGATNIVVSRECVGHDAINLTIDSYIDQENFYRELSCPGKVRKYGMVIDLATEQAGVVEGEIFTENLSSLLSLKNMIIKKKVGDTVVPTTDLLNSPAKFHLVHEDPGQLERDYEVIQSVGRVGFILRKEETLTSGASGASRAAEASIYDTCVSAAEQPLSTLWKREYERGGIPSSYRTEPSSVVSDFFQEYLKEKHAPMNVVADIGCGLGRNSLFFAQKGAMVYAMDIVAENIAQLQKYAAENELKIIAVCGDITEALPIPDKSVDIVMDVFCYKHQVDDKKREFYRRELCRVMKDTGYCLLSLAGKEDGYYGSLPRVEDKIIDPHTEVGSVLFDPEDIKREFDGYIIKKMQTVRKEGVMHRETYMRVTHAFIMQIDLPENRVDSDATGYGIHLK